MPNLDDLNHELYQIMIMRLHRLVFSCRLPGTFIPERILVSVCRQ